MPQKKGGPKMLFDLNSEESVLVVKTFLQGARSGGKTIGLTSGCFDLIHFHHFSFFIRCRRYCDFLIVGVDSDELVRGAKGASRPIVPDFHRAIMVDALRPVSFVFIMNSVVDFGRVAEIFTPEVIFKNDEFKGRENEIIGKEHAKRVIILNDQVDHSSTTDIIRRVSKTTSPE